MTKFTQKSFSVPVGDSPAYRDNWGEIDWSDKGGGAQGKIRDPRHPKLDAFVGKYTNGDSTDVRERFVEDLKEVLKEWVETDRD